jgi:predicted MPP superfamily phosphohydrolase
MLSRRALLQSATFAGTGIAVAAVTRDMRRDGYTGTPVLERLKLTVSNLPPAFKGYRIGYLTDLHLGLWVPQSWITNAIETLLREKVDILLLGGDYIFVSDNPLWETTGCVRNTDYFNISRTEMAKGAFSDVCEIIARYSFRDGIVGVVGNHENWNSIDLFMTAARAHPSLRILINESHRITRGDSSIEILGVDDFLTGFPIKPPPRATESTRILLSHNPDYVAMLLEEEKNSFDLALCGHTHGGQVRVPGLMGVVIPVQDPRFMSGLTDIGTGYVYTSRGLGVVGLPIRVNCPPEITVIELG